MATLARAGPDRADRRVKADLLQADHEQRVRTCGPDRQRALRAQGAVNRAQARQGIQPLVFVIGQALWTCLLYTSDAADEVTPV